MIYNITIHIIKIIFSLLRLSNEKAKHVIKNHLKLIESNDINNVIWFHCASLGEYEQAVPLINDIKKKYKSKILLTFFSASGYKNYRKNNNIEYVYYLPFDTKKNAKILVEKIKPKMLFISGNDFWFNYLKELIKNKIPVYVFNCSFVNQFYFKFYGKYFLNILKKVNFFYTKDINSQNVLNKNKIYNCKYIGNLRCDRIINKKNNTKEIKEINYFRNSSKIILGGSTYEKDDDILINFIQKEKEYKLIIAPHDINQNRIKSIKRKVKNKCHLLSELQNRTVKHNILIIDQMNILFDAYKYADIVFIGGGFNKGIHNILEPLVFHKPVFFGKKYEKFDEAIYMINKKITHCVYSHKEIKKEPLSVEARKNIDMYFNKNRQIHSIIINDTI